MKIGYDAKRIFHNHTGLGNYSRSLVRNLLRFYPQYVAHLFTPSIKNEDWADYFSDVATPNIHTATTSPSWYWRTFKMLPDLAAQNIDLYHGLSHELPYGIQGSKIKSILTVHDLIFKIYPQQYKPIDRIIYDQKMRYASRAADLIIAISEHTKRDIVEHYKVSPDKIEVVYQTCNDRFLERSAAADIQATLQDFRLPNDFLLYVGSVIERKNLLTLVEAMRLLPYDLPLIVVGGGKAYKQKVQTYVKAHQLERKVLFLSNVSNTALHHLYQQARVFIYPSMYEGFGIPIIEAIFSETPVITTTHSALPEAAGQYANLVQGTDAEELSAAIQNILANPTTTQLQVEQSLAYAHERFTPQATATRLHEVYQLLAGL